MAIGDIPKIPQEYKPRIQKLVKRMKAKEITTEEVLNNILTVLGKVTIDSKGIKIAGDYGSFEIGTIGISSPMNAAISLLDVLPIFIGKKFITKRGNEITMVKISILGLKKSRASEKDMKNPRLPIVEYNTQNEKKENESIFNILDMYLHEPQSGAEPASGFRIHRVEEFAGWFGSGWSNMAKLFRVNLPMSQLMTKEILDKLGESMAPFCDQVLRKCGV